MMRSQLSVLEKLDMGRVAGGPYFDLSFLLRARTMRGYHFRKAREGRVRRRVPRSRCVRAGLSFDLGCGAGALDAAWIETLLRERRFAFCDVQLLPQIAFSGYEGSAGCICTRVGSSSCRVSIPDDRLRLHAGPCASIDERAGERNAVDRAANAKAAGFAEDAETETNCRPETDGIYVWRERRGITGVLAGKILRLQCLSRRK